MEIENEEVLEELIKELSVKYNKKEKIIRIMLEKCFEFKYNINDSKKIIIDFLES